MLRQRRFDAIDGFFPKKPNSSRDEQIRYRDLPYLSRPIVEYLHDIQPDVAIAGDRGGRLFAFSIFQSWKRRFPDHPFPTRDQSIHFARVSARSAESESVKQAVHFTLERAGLVKGERWFGRARENRAPKVVYIDDWAVYGDTLGRFVKAAKEFGIPKSAVTYATMCGGRADKNIDHIMGDPLRSPRRSEWNDDDFASGVCFPYDDNVTPKVIRGDGAPLEVRMGIMDRLDRYYEQFSKAVATGQLATCSCVEPNVDRLTQGAELLI